MWAAPRKSTEEWLAVDTGISVRFAWEKICIWSSIIFWEYCFKISLMKNFNITPIFQIDNWIKDISDSSKETFGVNFPSQIFLL